MGRQFRALIPHGGQMLAVEYCPDALAAPEFAGLADRVGAGDFELGDRALARLLRAWNVERDGRPVPITEAAISALPLGTKWAILDGIAADGRRRRPVPKPAARAAHRRRR